MWTYCLRNLAKTKCTIIKSDQNYILKIFKILILKLKANGLNYGLFS